MARKLNYEGMIQNSQKKILEYIEKNDTGSILIIGNNATGKTHLINVLCNELLKEKDSERIPYLIGTRNRTFNLGDFNKSISRENLTLSEEQRKTKSDIEQRKLIQEKLQAVVDSIAFHRSAAESQYSEDDITRYVEGDGLSGRAVDYIRPCVESAISCFNKYLGTELSIRWGKEINLTSITEEVSKQPEDILPVSPEIMDDGSGGNDLFSVLPDDGTISDEMKDVDDSTERKKMRKKMGKNIISEVTVPQAYYSDTPMILSTGHQAILRIFTELEFLTNKEVGAGNSPEKCIVFLDEPDQQLSVKQNSTFLRFIQENWKGIRVVAAVHSVDFVRNARDCQILGIPNPDKKQKFMEPLWHDSEQFTSYASIYTELRILRMENSREDPSEIYHGILSENEHRLREYYIYSQERALTEDERQEIREIKENTSLTNVEKLLLRYIEEQINGNQG